MKRAILLLALILAPSVCLSAFLNGYGLLQWCEANTALAQTQCTSYLMGAADAFNRVNLRMLLNMRQVIEEAKGRAKQATREQSAEKLKKHSCIPERVTADQLRPVFLKWTKAHPKELSYEASGLVQLALAETWPCEL